VGSKRIAGITFRVYAGEHEGARFPHVHAKFNEGEVIVELTADRAVRLSAQHRRPVDPHVKNRDIRRAVRVAAAAFDELMALWEESCA
jgi:hypothetical protein